MRNFSFLFLLTPALVCCASVILVSCAPAVPYDQMPGAPGDLYSDANSNRMTADAALRQAQWQEQALTATSQAPIVRITETAAALSVQATQAEGTSIAAVQTQAGAMSATAVLWTPTANATQTAAFAQLNAEGTLIANNLERDRLELVRQQTMNDFNAKVTAYSWVIVVLVLALALMLVVRRWRYQTARVDARGNILPILDIVEGSFTDIDRSPNYRGAVSNDLLVRILAHIVEKKLGIAPLLPTVTAARQDAATERDQMIDLATRGLPGPSSETKETKKLAGQQMMKQLTESNLESRFRILDGTAHVPEIIDGQIVQVLDEEWKEAVKK